MKKLLVLIIILQSALSLDAQTTDEWIMVDSTYMNIPPDAMGLKYSFYDLMSNFQDKLIYYNINTTPPNGNKNFLKYSSNGGLTWNITLEREWASLSSYKYWYSLSTPSENKIIISEDSIVTNSAVIDGKTKIYFKRHATLIISDDRGVTYRTIKFDSNTAITNINMSDEYTGIAYLNNLSNPLYQNPLKSTELLITEDGWLSHRKIDIPDTAMLLKGAVMLGDGTIIMQLIDTVSNKRYLYYSKNKAKDWEHYELNLDDKKYIVNGFLSEKEIFFEEVNPLESGYLRYKRIIRTLDAGKSYDTVLTFSADSIYFNFFVLDTANYIVIYYGKYPEFNIMQRTTNSGKSWTEQFYRTQTALSQLYYHPEVLLKINNNIFYMRTTGGYFSGSNIYKHTSAKALEPTVPYLIGDMDLHSNYKADSIQVWWNKVEGADSYKIEITGIPKSDILNPTLTQGPFPVHNAFSNIVTDTTVLLTNLKYFEFYTVNLSSQNASMKSITGEAYIITDSSDFGKPVFTYPDTTITGNYTKNKILLKWTSRPGAESYDLCIQYIVPRSTGVLSDIITLVKDKGLKDTSYLLEGLVSKTGYYFYVRAVKSDEITDFNYSSIYTDNELGIEDNAHISNSGLNISPNPAGDYIDISVSSNIRLKPSVAEDEDIRIYNVLGECVKKVQPSLISATLNERQGTGVRIDVSDLTSGLYYCNINTGTCIITKSFIILK